LIISILICSSTGCAPPLVESLSANRTTEFWALAAEDNAVGGTHAERFGLIDIDGLVVLATGYSQKCSYSNQG
jgi:hypothetical protein